MEKKPKTTTLTAAQKAMLDEYDAIVKGGKLSLLLPFLQKNAKGNMEALKKQMRKNKRVYMNWETYGNENQRKIVTLSELALCSGSEMGANADVFELLQRLNFADNTLYNLDLRILQWAKPTWLGNFLLNLARQNRILQYKILRFLEKDGLLDYNIELFTHSVGNGTGYFTGDYDKILEDTVQNVLNDSIMYERDIPQIFNYEVNIQNWAYRYYAAKTEWVEPKDWVIIEVWKAIFLRLIAEQKMSRTLFIENALLIQTKDWNKNLQGFYRKILTELQPTAAELVALQHTIFPFLHSPLTPIVGYGVDLIKKIHEHEGFDTNAFLEWVEPTMMRADCKTAIKNVLVIFDKISKKQPALNAKLAELVADAFVVADLTLQERAAKSFLKMATPENQAISDKIAEYEPLLQSSVRLLLAVFLQNSLETTSETPTETYAFAPKKPKLLTTPVVLPQTWNDIVFHFGKFIQSDEPLDGEILLNIYITQFYLFPADYAEQLKPYFGQMENTYFEYQKDFVKQFVVSKKTNLNTKTAINTHYYTKIKILSLFKNIVAKAQEKIQQNNDFSLLSMPTHAPYFIAPKILLERLIRVELTNEKIDYTDFAIAISRMVRENVAEALPLFDKLSDKYKPLMRFCLGLDKTIYIENQNAASSFLSKILVAVGGKAQTADDTALWAVAARTFYPLETFDEFEKTYFADRPFVKTPYRPEVFCKEKWQEVYDYQTKKNVNTMVGYEINFDGFTRKLVPSHLLYSIGSMGSAAYWDLLYSDTSVTNWHSITPQNDESLAYYLLKSICRQPNGACPELKGFLQIANRPEFWFCEPTTLVFATCFFREKKEIRLMASEVLMNLIQEKKVEMHLLGEKIALLLSNKYAGVQRLSDALTAIKDVSRVHNSALFLLLDAFFAHFEAAEKLPTNFRKLVELYADLKTKTQGKTSEKAVLFFEKWKGNAAVKSM